MGLKTELETFYIKQGRSDIKKEKCIRVIKAVKFFSDVHRYSSAITQIHLLNDGRTSIIA